MVLPGTPMDSDYLSVYSYILVFIQFIHITEICQTSFGKMGQIDQRGEVQGVPKNALSECCWSHSALAQSQVAGTLFLWKLIFFSFLTKTKPDQAFPNHVHGKI